MTSGLAATEDLRAQNLFGDAGFSASHGSYSSVPYEHVDPLSGNLIIVVNDLSLPGNAGLDLRVTRSYNSKFHRDFENNDHALDERTPLGVGWRLHFGRVLHDDSNQPGETIIETPDGGGQPLYWSTGGHGWMSKSFWRYDRATNRAYLPNGLIYIFDHIGETSGPRGRVRYVTEIRDQFNNWITFEYGGNGSLPGSISRIRQYLSPTQIREVLFHYSNGSLDRMVYDGREWRYEYAQAPGWSGEWVLSRVVPPIGLSWAYLYLNTGAGPELTGLRPPGGGEMNYEYATVDRVASTLNQSSRVVSRRTTGGTRITQGTWTFSYNQGTNLDTTVIDCPCGRITYRYAGIGSSGNFSAWKSGVLVERTIAEPGSSVPLESEEISYQPSAAISNDPVPGQNGVWSDPAVYQALVHQRVLTRDGTPSQTTTFHYNAANYNDFGRAWRVVAAGNQTRTTDRTFNYNLAPVWIVNGPATESVTIGGQTRTSAFTYDANGFLTRSNTFGLIVDFEPNAAGQVAKSKDQHNHEMTFTYSWGALADTVTPLLTTSRAINPDGTVDSETVGTLTTRYIYDVGGRLRKVRPPNVNEITYEYDDVSTYFVRTGRGSAMTEQLLDGFGRVTTSSDTAGVKTKVERDACGRVIRASAPYTGTDPTRWTSTTYDALGRPRTVTAPGTPLSVTTYTYTGADVSIFDAEGRKTSYDYDAFSGPGDARLMRVTDARNTDTNYQYDVLGGLTRVEGPGPGPARVWVYNTRGELASETQPESGTTSYVYDNAGNLTQVTNAVNTPNQVVTTFTYDQNDRLKTRTVATDHTSNLTITYDNLGRVQEQSIDGVITTFGYDTTGRPSSRRDRIHPNMDFTSSYLYDANDNLTTTVYPSGRQVTYEYDNAFRLAGLRNNGAVFAGNFVYDSAGRLQSYYTGAVGHTTLYDDRDRVREVAAGPGIGHMRLTYGYDKVSNVKTITDARVGAPVTTQSYTYDELNRMKTSNGPWGSIAWTYDPAGNRLTEMRGGTTAYAYDGATNRLTGTTGANPETFTWNAAGQLATNARGNTTTTYTYTPAGMLKTASTAGLTASYLYDADHLRVKREVNGRTYVTVRSFGGQVLSEYESCGGAPVWSRDNVYAGSRLLGAARASGTLPSLEFEMAASNVAEAAGSATPRVRLTTPNGAPLACAVSVKYKTQNGAASDEHDYAAIADQTLTFPAGTASGTLLPIPTAVTIYNDPYREPAEAFAVTLTAGTGVTLGAQATHTVTIQDNDPAPTVSIRVKPGYESVSEGAVHARFELVLSERTGYQVQVTYATSPNTAQGGGQDYADWTANAVVPPMSPTSAEILIPVIDDGYAEPLTSETFFVDIYSLVNAFNGTMRATGTIIDNEPPRAPIDLTKQGVFFADSTSLSGKDDYVVIGNHHDTSPMTVRLTFTRPDGSGLTREVVVAAKGRYSFRVGDEPGLGTTDVSLAVQSLTADAPVMADHVVYEGPGWEAGRATEGVSPAPVWYLAEGSVGYFDEWITVFNPSSDPVNVWFSFMGSGVGTVLPIPTGPGRIKINVRDFLVGDHATQIVGYKMGTEITSPIVVERTMFWQTDRRESHSSPGIPGTDLSMNWYFAEGSTGFNTFLALANPYGVATPATVQYLHENGSMYSESVTVPASGRLTMPAPAWLPLGAFGYRITSTVVPIAAERSMYGGTNLTVGTTGVGVKAPATNWVFQEGATGTFWDTYILLANPSSTQASVWLALRPDSGSSIVWHNVLVPANSRRSVHVNYVPGMPGTVFRTEVISDYPVVAERVTYWPGASSGLMAMQGGGDPMLLGTDSANEIGSANESAIGSANETAIGNASSEVLMGSARALPSPRVTLSPYTTLRRAVPVNLYQTLTPGEPAGAVERDLAEKTLENEAIDGEIFRATPFDASSLTSGSSWYGGHLTGGRRP